MRKVRELGRPRPNYIGACAYLVLVTSMTRATVPFSINGPGVNPTDFRMTTFATGLNYPVGMVALSDGSILVAVSHQASFFNGTSGALIRLADTDNDGVADSEITLFDSVPGGQLTALRRAGDLFLTSGFRRPISILRAGAAPSDLLTLVGSIDINYPAGNWSHPNSALGVRPTPGQPNSYDVFFQLGSQANFATTTATASLTSDIGVSGSLAGDAVHMFTITDDGVNVTGSNLRQVATGLRNPAGFAFHPATGDLYLQDNGIDGFVDSNEPESADELNVITAADIGVNIVDFGFHENYTQYRSGTIIGGDGVQPVVAFQPIPDPRTGDESEGPNDIAFAPPQFPDALNNGVFVGMHGRFSLGGLANEENPLVFLDLNDGSYFHFIQNNERGVGHLDGLLSTEDSLFIADISPRGGFSGGAANSGAIYQIKSLVPEPSSGWLAVIGLLVLARRATGLTPSWRSRNSSVTSKPKNSAVAVCPTCSVRLKSLSSEPSTGSIVSRGGYGLPGIFRSAKEIGTQVRIFTRTDHAVGNGTFISQGRGNPMERTTIKAIDFSQGVEKYVLQSRCLCGS